MRKDIRDDNGRLLCVYISSLLTTKTVDFLDIEDSLLEFARMHRGPKNPVKLHRHVERERFSRSRTQELIVQLNGAMNVRICNDRGNLIETIESSMPSIFLFLSGSHAIDFQEYTDILEVKTGPYEAEDKVWIPQ